MDGYVRLEQNVYGQHIMVGTTIWWNDNVSNNIGTCSTSSSSWLEKNMHVLYALASFSNVRPATTNSQESAYPSCLKQNRNDSWVCPNHSFKCVGLHNCNQNNTTVCCIWQSSFYLPANVSILHVQLAYHQ